MLTAMTTPGSGAKDWQRLAKYVVDRRNAYGWTQEDVRAAGGPSTATMRLIEGARQDSYKPRVLASLERALLWRPGSVDAILNGGDPTLTSGPELKPRLATRTERLQLILAAIEDPNVDWDIDADVLELMAKKVRAALKRAQDPANRDTRDVG